MSLNERLAALRKAMKVQNIDAYIIPSSDPHQSEYPAEHWKIRWWIAPFTGSMGFAVITHDTATIWTDSRYFLQCEAELKGSDFTLRKQVIQGAPEHVDWLAQSLKAGSAIGCDGTLFSVSQVRAMQAIFTPKDLLLKTDQDLIPSIWTDRPSLPKNAIFEHDLIFAGQSRADKIAAIRTKMIATGADIHLVSTLDDIGWTLNLRGSDVDCNPVFIAYLVISLTRCELFIDLSKVSSEIKTALNNDGIILRSYDLLDNHLAKLPSKQSIALDPSTINFSLFNTIKKAKVIECETFSTKMKAIKNPVEQEYLRQVMVKDGVALTKAFIWLEKTLLERTVTEYEVGCMLAQYRSDQAHYFGESFNAIVAYNANGALNHYRADPHDSAVIAREGILLIDSGGQYADGTTDITRTLSLDGSPTAEQRRNYTLVLRGHIALAMMRFPTGTKGIQLDTLARMFLWREGLNYGHGTGHGVGFFMNVHEPPQGFAPSLSPRGTTAHEPGMYSSNEPGFYKEGAYGIRIENLVIVQEDVETDFGKFYRFETITLFPIDTTLVETSLLKKEERRWLNDYHKEVYQKLSPHLNKKERAWLKGKCRKIRK